MHYFTVSLGQGQSRYWKYIWSKCGIPSMSAGYNNIGYSNNYDSIFPFFFVMYYSYLKHSWMIQPTHCANTGSTMSSVWRPLLRVTRYTKWVQDFKRPVRRTEIVGNKWTCLCRLIPPKAYVFNDMTECMTSLKSQPQPTKSSLIPQRQPITILPILQYCPLTIKTIIRVKGAFYNSKRNIV